MRSWLGKFFLTFAVAVLASDPPRVTAGDVWDAFGPGVHRGLIIGDSISRSGGAKMADARDTYTARFFEEGIFLTTMARGGALAHNLPKYVEAVLDLNAIDNWRFAAVFLGTNDFSFAIPLKDVMSSYRGFLERVLEDPSYKRNPRYYQTLFCITPIRRADESAPNKLGYTMPDLRAAITGLCTELGVPVIDGLTLVPEDPTVQRNKESVYFQDGLHPNKAGQAELATRLLGAITEHFKEHSKWVEIWARSKTKNRGRKDRARAARTAPQPKSRATPESESPR